MKGKFDGDTIKKLAVNHVEKGVLVMVLGVFSFMVYSGLSIKPFPTSQTPESLTTKANQVLDELEQNHWDAIKEEYAEKVLRRVEQRTGMKDLRSRIVAKRIVTPADWEASSIFLGATFNLAHTLGQMLYMRPHNEWEGAENCYLVGGGTHPGSGLPTIYESGRISANLVCDRFGVPYQSVDLASGFMNGE